MHMASTHPATNAQNAHLLADAPRLVAWGIDHGLIHCQVPPVPNRPLMAWMIEHPVGRPMHSRRIAVALQVSQSGAWYWLRRYAEAGLISQRLHICGNRTEYFTTPTQVEAMRTLLEPTTGPMHTPEHEEPDHD